MLVAIDKPVDAFQIHPNIKRSLIRQNGEPFDCVRELVANSLDAGATAVWVQIRDLSGGTYALDVQDNGCGMDKKHLEDYAFTMFRSASDDVKESVLQEQRVGIFGVGLFSTLALPDVVSLIYLTKVKKCVGKFLYAVIDPKTLTYSIKQSDSWHRSSKFETTIKVGLETLTIELEPPNNLKGTNVTTIFHTKKQIHEVRDLIASILKRYFTFSHRDTYIYFESEVLSANQGYRVSQPLRINSIFPSMIDISNPRAEESTGVIDLGEKIPYRIKIDCDIPPQYSERKGLYLLTGKGVTLVKFDEFSVIPDTPEVKFKFSHCIVTVTTKELLDYPISRGTVYETEAFIRLIQHIFWEHIVRFAIRSVNILTERDLYLYNNPILHYMQNVVGFLHACKAKGNLVFPSKDLESDTKRILFTRQIFPLYNGDRHSWGTIADVASSNQNKLEYFNDRLLLEKLQLIRMLNKQSMGQAFIVATVANPDLLVYYRHCFEMEEVSTDYRLESLEERDEWMEALLSEMVALGHTDPQGVIVTAVYFREWYGQQDLMSPPLFEDRKKHMLYVNLNSPLIKQIIVVGTKDPYLAGHLFKKLHIREEFTVETRHSSLVKDIMERFRNMER